MIDLHAARKHLAASDPKVGKLLDDYIAAKKTAPQKSEPDLYARELFASIVSQQLSTKVADVIWSRFVKLVENPDDPNVVKNFTIEQLRSVGLSNQKANYIIAIATGVTNGTVRLDHLDTLSDKEIIDELTTLKGIGRWTAEMFLLFTLARPDVFSVGDLGLKNAASRFMGKELSPEKLLAISQKWSPYRSSVSLALWHSLDNK